MLMHQSKKRLEQGETSSRTQTWGQTEKGQVAKEKGPLTSTKRRPSQLLGFRHALSYQRRAQPPGDPPRAPIQDVARKTHSHVQLNANVRQRLLIHNLGRHTVDGPLPTAIYDVWRTRQISVFGMGDWTSPNLSVRIKVHQLNAAAVISITVWT